MTLLCNCQLEQYARLVILIQVYFYDRLDDVRHFCIEFCPSQNKDQSRLLARHRFHFASYKFYTYPHTHTHTHNRKCACTSPCKQKYFCLFARRQNYTFSVCQVEMPLIGLLGCECVCVCVCDHPIGNSNPFKDCFQYFVLLQGLMYLHFGLVKQLATSVFQVTVLCSRQIEECSAAMCKLENQIPFKIIEYNFQFSMLCLPYFAPPRIMLQKT